MATLEKIRSNGWLITAIIGIALLIFIWQIATNDQGRTSSNDNEIAVIDGNSISYEFFQYRISTLEDYTKIEYQRSSLDENIQNRIHDQAWEQLVRENILNNQYAKLGIVVTDFEMGHLIAGKDAHPMIKRMFTDPQTGIFNESAAIEYYRRRNENPQAAFYWDFIIKQIKEERLFNKYSALLSKGIYTPVSQLNYIAASKKNKVDFDFVVKPYRSISDSTVKISDSEIKSYYKEHEKNYKQEASRDVKYVVFDILPSEEDNKATLAGIEKSKLTFSKPDIDVAQYIDRNSDNTPYFPKNLKVEDIPSALKIFATTAKVGDVYGPYFENDTYKLTRLVAIRQLPDSVKARHILIKSDNPSAEAIADSLYKLIKGGKDFAEIARENSQDPGSAVNGGDLDWFQEGRMVKPFNDACFNGNKGDLVKVQSDFGWHIIHIQDMGKSSTKYELATLEKKVTYSETTKDNVYAIANKFISENETSAKFDAAIQSQNMTPRFGTGLKKNDRMVGSLQSPRQMVKWAFEAEPGDISPIFEFGDAFVIAVLTGSKEEGIASINQVKEQIKAELIKDKKTEIIKKEFEEAIKSSQSLSSVAQKMGSSVQSASGVHFGSSQVSGAGFEPALVALATTSQSGIISGPVKGNNGVYIVKVNSISTQEVNLESEKAQMAQENNYRIYRAYEALKNKAEIEDKRINFY